MRTAHFLPLSKDLQKYDSLQNENLECCVQTDWLWSLFTGEISRICIFSEELAASVNIWRSSWPSRLKRDIYVMSQYSLEHFGLPSLLFWSAVCYSQMMVFTFSPSSNYHLLSSVMPSPALPVHTALSCSSVVCGHQFPFKSTKPPLESKG